MTQIFTALALWLHSLATVVLIGYFVLLSWLYLPVFMKNQANLLTGMILSGISKSSRNWMYGSILVFIITGVYVMFVDPNYLGVGNFGNLWSILMLIKHIVILGMVGAGFWYNAIQRVGPQLQTGIEPALAFARFRQYNNLMAMAGVIVLLLTAISQAQ